MSEHQIDFCTHLARAVALGQKTVTYKPLSRGELRQQAAGQPVTSPYGQVGDVLWVREPFSLLNGNVIYQANYAVDGYRGRVTLPDDAETPAVSLTRQQVRLLLTVQTVSIVALQTIDEAAANAAGTLPSSGRTTYLDEFKAQWDEAYRQWPWSANPQCWRVSFTKNP